MAAVQIPALVEAFRSRVVSSATSPFHHAAYPLTRTLDYPGDPGLFGPGSATWEIIGDVGAFVGGIRALLIQAAHPEVVAGVVEHSRYQQDPLGRLSRTSNYVTATAFGAMPEVNQAVDIVKRAHRPVHGESHRARPYRADAPELAAWVHNALTDSFLATYRAYGERPLTEADADRYIQEQSRLGSMLYADPLPETAADLAAWLARHPDASPSPGMQEAVSFLRNPPLPPALKAGYTVMFAAAVATIPPRLRQILGLTIRPGARAGGVAITRYLRWALGASPTWELALRRAGAEVPAGRFKQPLPAPAIEGRDLSQYQTGQ